MYETGPEHFVVFRACFVYILRLCPWTFRNAFCKISLDFLKEAGTKELRVYIETLKRAASERGESSLVLRAGAIHKEKGLKNSMPIVCNAMRQCMEEGDEVLYEPPSGYSSALEIRYLLQAGEHNDSGRTPTTG